MGRSPTQLSLDFLNKSGWTCAIVEKWNAHAGIRQDLFGFADIIAYHATGAIALIQTTSASHHAERKAKILSNPHFAGWKKACGTVFLHSWGKNGLREESL